MKILESIGNSLRRLFGGGKDRKTGGAVAGETKIDTAVLVEKIKAGELFSNLPDGNIAGMLSNMETVKMANGTVVIREGDEGDYYYLLTKGTASVSKKGKESGKSDIVASLSAVTGFGEEALISNAKRNSTVTMSEDGVLMRLSKSGFNDQVKDPMVSWLSPAQAQQHINGGAKWFDVREDAGSASGRLRGAVVIPLSSLRGSLGDVDRESEYICYCDNGRLSSTAAFLLMQKGYKVFVLRGGLKALERTRSS
ncbi:MAG: cyclic nucleotide-binding domain-containing protein [Lentisphaerales bacterium]|jgi:rhodanese-related sulfurtransferase|nr:MAG: cyclic nucleotide-binding domain-containing protein [Lentisphaerales bacterium]